MKIPDPGGEVKVTLVLGCHDCTQLVEAVAKIDDIVRNKSASEVAFRLEGVTRSEHTKFVQAAMNLAKFVRSEITEV